MPTNGNWSCAQKLVPRNGEGSGNSILPPNCLTTVLDRMRKRCNEWVPKQVFAATADGAKRKGKDDDRYYSSGRVLGRC